MSKDQDVNKKENTLHIWYAKSYHPCYPPYYDARKTVPNYTQLVNYYSKIREMSPTGLNLIFEDMNIGAWNQDRNNQIIVKALGVHTSMSIGDLVHNTETNTWYKCDSGGWTRFQMNPNDTTEIFEDNSQI